MIPPCFFFKCGKTFPRHEGMRKSLSKNLPTSAPIESMGLVYSPTNLPSKSTIHVGKYIYIYRSSHGSSGYCRRLMNASMVQATWRYSSSHCCRGWGDQVTEQAPFKGLFYFFLIFWLREGGHFRVLLALLNSSWVTPKRPGRKNSDLRD